MNISIVVKGEGNTADECYEQFSENITRQLSKEGQYIYRTPPHSYVEYDYLAMTEYHVWAARLFSVESLPSGFPEVTVDNWDKICKDYPTIGDAPVCRVADIVV